MTWAFQGGEGPISPHSPLHWSLVLCEAGMSRWMDRASLGDKLDQEGPEWPQGTAAGMLRAVSCLPSAGHPLTHLWAGGGLSSSGPHTLLLGSVARSHRDWLTGPLASHCPLGWEEGTQQVSFDALPKMLGFRPWLTTLPI